MCFWGRPPGHLITSRFAPNALRATHRGAAFYFLRPLKPEIDSTRGRDGSFVCNSIAREFLSSQLSALCCKGVRFLWVSRSAQIVIPRGAYNIHRGGSLYDLTNSILSWWEFLTRVWGGQKVLLVFDSLIVKNWCVFWKKKSHFSQSIFSPIYFFPLK